MTKCHRCEFGPKDRVGGRTFVGDEPLLVLCRECFLLLCDRPTREGHDAMRAVADAARARIAELEAAVADFEDARHQRRLLGEALRSVLVAAGMIVEDAAPTGPELLLCAEEFVKDEARRRRLESTQDRGEIA